MLFRTVFCALALGAANSSAMAAEALYLANEGVLVTDGDTTVMFDPLFENGFGRYQLMPTDMARRLFAGEPPFDGVDALFVSHAHGDHFSSRLVLDYLRAWPEVLLYAPAQAVTQLRSEANESDARLFDRVTGLALDNGEAAVRFDVGKLSLAAFRVPHSGWPDRRTDIENLVFQVTLNDNTTVAHFGDADANPAHFRPTADIWRQRQTDLAMPPYWFLSSDGGNAVLSDIVRPGADVGTHVPTSVPNDPDDRPPEFDGLDLFTEPGESRVIP